jgi:hypothetical protein
MRASDYKRLNDRKAELVKIVLYEKDGTETVIDLDEHLHYIFSFTKTKSKEDGERFVPMEIIIRGNVDIVGEMFYQLGERNPSLIEHCARRAFAKSLEMLKAKGVDPTEEAFKIVPVVGGVQ